MINRQEREIFQRAGRYGEWDMFTSHYFRLPLSGTWYTTEDRPEQYAAIFAAWKKLGRPDESIKLTLDGVEAELKVVWDPYYDGYPMFLLPHGFKTLPWMSDFLSPNITKAIAVTGAGTGKTCGVAIFALAMCAIFPGFKFLNVAPTQIQAELMLGEIEKWVIGSPFEKFIKPSRGAHKLWIERPYPTISIEIEEGFPSQFVCQTVGRDATAILGGERDWINIDEAQLLEGISSAQDIFTTRLRGTRSTGHHRLSKLTWITNPGANAELMALIDQYKSLIEEGYDNVLVLENITSSKNIYVTKRQLRDQSLTMSDIKQARWHGGEMAAIYIDADIGEHLVNKCLDDELTEVVEEYGVVNDELGVVDYELPYAQGRSYIVAGDTGKSPLVGMSSQNVPCVMVFDVTDFTEGGWKLVAFSWFDGMGSYDPFIRKMRKYMMKYRAVGYYDAGNVQSAFEDMEGAGFDGFPTYPVFFSGASNQKRWAIAIAVSLLSDGMFSFPYIKSLWHQARIYNARKTSQADDVIATLLVFCLALRAENTLWDKLVERYNWEIDEEDRETEEWDGKVLVPSDRYSRVVLPGLR